MSYGCKPGTVYVGVCIVVGLLIGIVEAAW